MDKYQNIFFEYAFNDYKKQELHLKNITSLKSGEVCGDFDIANEKVNVNQEKDITSNQRVLPNFIAVFIHHFVKIASVTEIEFKVRFQLYAKFYYNRFNVAFL